MLPEGFGMLKIRAATKEDRRLLWEWANDSEARAASFNSEQIAWGQHVKWFDKKMHDPNCYLYVITNEKSEPIGQIRFDIEKPGAAVISVGMERQIRNRGYGTQALELSLRRISKDADVRQVVAYVKPENRQSIRAFEKAGFAKMVECNVKGQPALQFLWQRC